MSILNDIKHRYGIWKLKRSNIETKRAHQVFNLDEAKRVTILFDGTEAEDVLLVKRFVSELSKGKEVVSALGYVNVEDRSFEHMSSLHFDYFSNQELNWYGKPQGMVVENFLKEDYDILIDLSLKEHYPLTYMTVASPAKFKVGRYRADIDVYDLMINHKQKPDLKGLIHELNHYLRLIKPGR